MPHLLIREIFLSTAGVSPLANFFEVVHGPLLLFRSGISTKNLLISIERIRRKYDKGMYRLTDKVRPWTEEEIVAGVQTVTDSLTGMDTALCLQHPV